MFEMRDEEKTKEQLLSEMESLRREVAESKKAGCECRWVEAALRESEERYKRLVESITDYIYTVKVENGLPVSTTHGPGCLAVTGYTSDYFQIYPRLWYQMIHEEDREAVLNQVEKILSGEAVQPLEHRIICKDGSIRWVRNTPVPHYDKDGRLLSYEGIIVDISERKKAEEALRASREYARNIIESSMDMIIAVDKDRRITEFNKAAQETFGYAPEEVLGKHVDILYADPSEGLRVHDVTLENGRHLQEIVNRRKNGELFPSLLSSSVLRNAQGDIVGLMGVSHDITRRKRDEEALKESFAKIERAKRDWEATFDAITDPLFIHDREFGITRANRAYAEAAGLPFSEIIGRPYYEVFPRMEGPFTVCKKALISLKMEEEEFSVSAINKIFRVRYYPVKDVDGNYPHSIHIMEDITEQKRAEERLRQEMGVTSHLLMIAEATAHTTDIDKLMEQVVKCASKITGCGICLSYLWDSEIGVFRPGQESGLAHNLIPLFRTESLEMKVGFVKEAMKKREPVVKEVGAVHELPLQWIEDIHTLAVIPLIGRKGPLGMVVGIYVGAGLKPAPTIDERGMKVMKGISHQVSTALEEARLFKESVDNAMELSHKMETIKTMHEIDRSILSTLDPHDLMETVTRLVARILPCDRATVVNVDREKQMFNWGAGFGTPFLEGLRSAPFEDTSAGEIVRTGRTEYIVNLLDIKEPLPIEKGLIKEGFLSHIRVPLKTKGEVVGILSVGAKRPSAFTPENLSTLEYFGAQVGVALENARLVSDLEELFMGTIRSLASAIDAKSPWTAGHSERVTSYALLIGKEMGLSERELSDLELAGLLHDIGKIGTYDFLLDKPGKLEPDEIEMVRLHPGKGAEILEPIRRFGNIIPAIKHHHEFYDGTGYPDRLKGEDIPLLARILAVADTFDAMAADRPYRKGRPMDYMISEFKRCSGTQFDPKVAAAFLKVIGKREELRMAAN
jgi:PAS domain S-box-containing protein